MPKQLNEDKIEVERVKLCTGDTVYHAKSIETLAYGEGKTEQAAINDLKARA